MTKILMDFAWSIITGANFKSAALKALRNVLMIGGPFVTAFLQSHGVTGSDAGVFVSDGTGFLVSSAGVAMSVADWYSVKAQTASKAK